jgi:PmbA protein
VKFRDYESLQNIAEEAVRQALRFGADQADALLISEDELRITTRKGEVELVKRSGGKSLGLRVFADHQSAMVSSSDLQLSTVSNLASDALAVARQTSPDPLAFLPERPQYRELPLIEKWLDPEGLSLSVDRAIELASATEKAAMNADSRIRNSDGGSFAGSETTACYANSHGFSGTFPRSLFSLSAAPIAEDKGTMQRDYWYSVACFRDRLSSPEEVGTRAAARALRRLGAKKVASCEVPVVFDPLTAATLIREICDAISGAAIFRKASFLTDRLGQAIASPGVTLLDDPTLAEGLGSRPFDGEGLLTHPLSPVRDGILESYLLDTYSARKLGAQTTASAVRGASSAPSPGPSNFFLKPGTLDPGALIASVRRGLYVTGLIGFGVDLVSGNYSRGAVGLWIESGELTYPVEEITIAGNLGSMLQQIEAVANDLLWMGPVSSPTLKISNMTVSGK